jgi:L-alanine-DL-glutamate epimerase-like enolase superfamily enzyme
VVVGRNAEEDIERIRLIREAVGPDVCLMVDANGMWSPSTAIKILRKMQSYEVTYAEQPVPLDDIRGSAAVKKAVYPDTLIVADQGVHTPHDVQRIIDEEAADVICIKLVRTGLTKGKTMAVLANLAGIPISLGSHTESGVGSAACLQYAAAVKNLDTRLSELSLKRFENPLATGLESDEIGRVWRIPDRPGLGVEVDEENFEPA